MSDPTLTLKSIRPERRYTITDVAQVLNLSRDVIGRRIRKGTIVTGPDKRILGVTILEIAGPDVAKLRKPETQAARVKRDDAALAEAKRLAKAI